MIPQTNILVVDDEAETRHLLQEIMEKEGYVVRTAQDGKQALELLEGQGTDLVLSDIQMPLMNGIELLGNIRSRFPETQVILLTAYGSMTTAVEGIKSGAFDYISKPFVLDEVRLLVKRALDHKKILQENRSLKQQVQATFGIDQLQGKSSEMVAVYKLVARVAPSESTVLIQGESGTGKELIARAIHSNSERHDGPFVAVDCGTLAETLLESELFGHEKGAFTGAVGSKKGLLEMAHGGTCFLDEIGDITSALQSKLLRVLQEREIRRVGGQEAIGVNVRVVAASNKDLMKLVKSGKFREDLYYRLNVVTIQLPPLRERTDDIPLLVRYFLQKYGVTNTKKVTDISPKAMVLLQQYDWPGNVRELEHTIERAIVLTPHTTIVPEDLPPAISSQAPPPVGKDTGWKTLDQLEREQILKVLEAYKGDEVQAAEILGIHRKTLQRKLKEYGLR
jgi:DNA-binding NtrC family response regulator